MMALTDFTMYVALLSAIGWVPLAVTTQLNINFLRKPRASRPDRGGAAVETRQAAGGRGGHHLRRDGQDEAVAHATSTYSIPQRR